MKPDAQVNDAGETERPPSRAVMVFWVGLFLLPVWMLVGRCISPADARSMADGPVRVLYWPLSVIVFFFSLGACAIAPAWNCQHLGKKIMFGALGVIAWIISYGFANFMYVEWFGFVD